MQVGIEDTIVVVGAPALPGLRFRHFRGPADYPGLTEANNASEAADGEEWVATVEEIAHIHENVVNYDPARDLIIAAVDGRIIGSAFGSWRLETDGLYRFQIILTLMPEWRGRGLRRTMLRWLEARLREVAADLPAGAPKVFALGAPEQAESLRARTRRVCGRCARRSARSASAPLATCSNSQRASCVWRVPRRILPLPGPPDGA